MLIDHTDYFLTGAEPHEVWPLIRAHHYSRRMPGNIQHCYAARGQGGLFGNHGDLFAAAVFSIPPTRWGEELIELTRLVRLPTFSVPLSHLISFACSRLRKQGWALAVSFADQQQGHHGGVYQAAGWLYDGRRERQMDGVLINGVFRSGRSCNSQWGTRSPDKLRQILPSHSVEPHFDEGKHLYWKPLSIAGRSRARRLGLKALPYPKPNAARPLDEPLPGARAKCNPSGPLHDDENRI